MLPLTPPCTLGEAAWVVSDCAAPPLVGLGTARWLCHDVITASLQPYGCASSGVIGNVAASLLTFSIPREAQRVHKVYQLKRYTTPDPSPYVAICVWVFFGQQRGLHPRPATVSRPSEHSAYGPLHGMNAPRSKLRGIKTQNPQNSSIWTS